MTPKLLWLLWLTRWSTFDIYKISRVFWHYERPQNMLSFEKVLIRLLVVVIRSHCVIERLFESVGFYVEAVCPIIFYCPALQRLKFIGMYSFWDLQCERLTNKYSKICQYSLGHHNGLSASESTCLSLMTIYIWRIVRLTFERPQKKYRKSIKS